MITEFFYNNMAKVIIGILVFLLAIDILIYKNSTPEAIEATCQESEWVPVTHRDGFWYCHDDNTVSWNGEWKPATIIEKRRAGL